MSDPPRQPPPIPTRPAPPAASKSLWTIVLALLVGMAMFVGLVFLTGPVGPVVLAVGGGVFLLLLAAGAHYLVWGYWLGDSIRREVEQEELDKIQQQAAEKERNNPQDF